MPKRERLAQKQIHYDARRLRTLVSGAPGGAGPHRLLGTVHNDTDIAAPVRGAMVLADDTPEWDILLHPTAAGYALVTDAADVAWDQTPNWTGDHTWDDGDGDSPMLHLIPENDDDWMIWATNNATPGDSKLIIKFPAADTGALILFRDSGDNDVAHIDADGNTTWDGAAHRFGIADTTAAILTLSGDATGSDEGGQFTIELADDHDGVFNSWNVDVYEDDLRFFRNDAGVINAMTAEGQLRIPTTGSGAGVLLGGDAQWYRSAADVMSTPDDLYIATSGKGIIHVDGVADGQVLVADGTRYIPGDLSDITGGDAQYVVMAASATLANERVLTAGDGIALTDGGAGGNATVAVDLVAAWSGLEFNGGDLRVDEDAIFSWTGAHYHSATIVMDDAAGDSPALQFIGGSNDDSAVLYLVNDAVAGNSDFAIALSAADADSQFQIRTSGFAVAAWIDATGDASFADVNIASGSGIIHADGVAAGYVLLANGTRYVPAAANANVPVAPGGRGHIIRAEAGPVWASYNAATNGAVLIGDGTDIVSDTTPTLVGNLTMDDGAGDSPEIQFIGGSNDDAVRLYLMDAAVAGNSDFAIRLPAADADAQVRILTTGGATVAWIDAAGDAAFSQYVYHYGDADTFVRFQDDQLSLAAGGVTFLDLVEGATDYVDVGADVRLNAKKLYIGADDDTYVHESADDVISVAIAGNEQFDFDATELTLSTTGGTEVLWIRTHGDVAGTGADIYANAQLGLAADTDVWVFIDADGSQADATFNVGHDVEITGGTSPLFRVTEGPLVFVNETANADMTIGLTIQQGGNDDEIIAVKSSDVGHSMTDYAEADTYGVLAKAAGAAGGLTVRGLRDSDGSAWKALNLEGMLNEAADTTKTTAGHGVVAVSAAVTNGVDGGIQAVGTDGNLMTIENNGTTRFIFDAEGSAHGDVEWITFDEHDDLALLGGLEAAFGEFADAHRDELEALRIARFDGRAGHAMINWTRLSMLLVGAVRQNRAYIDRGFGALGVDPALLEA